MAFDTGHKSQHSSGSLPNVAVKYIVVHRTEGHEAGDLSVLTSGGGRSVSINFYVTEKGHVYQMLPWGAGANHAGFGASGLAAKYGNANHHAYGIELEGLERDPYSDAQLHALDTVIAAIDAHLGRKVPITTHAAIDPSRKSDPEHFTAILANYNKCRAHVCPAIPAPKPTPTPTPGRRMAVMLETVPLRWHPNGGQKGKEEAHAGGDVEVLQFKDGSAHIHWPGGDGWVPSKSLRLI